MRLTRIYSPEIPPIGREFFLDARASHHLLRVLRLKVGDAVIVFDGMGNEFLAEILAATKQQVQISTLKSRPFLPESPLHIHLGQAISRGEKMDYTIQKAVELGVSTITPLFTERSGVKLAAERVDTKLAHWQQIVISACEQSGRSYLPAITPPQQISTWLAQRQEKCKLMLHPYAEKHLKNIAPPDREICLLMGPEGGFSDEEVNLAERAGFEAINLGPRILRTETAAPAVISIVQGLWGDMG